MLNTEKIASTAKNSNRTSTPDCESVNFQFLSQVSNLLPKLEHHDEVHQKGEKNVVGNDNNVLAQTNHVQENRGITGITGTGHTITVNQCPDELIQLLIKFLKTLQQ
jgi:hypothetical protein